MDKINLSASMMVNREPEDAKTILSTSVMYAISDSGVNQPTEGWSPSVLATTKEQPWLWTRTTITYSEGEPSVSYSVSRQGSDGTNGTSFTPKGLADGYLAKSSDIKDYTVGKVYLVDKNDTSLPNINAPCIVKCVQFSGGTALSVSKATEGDGYNVGGTLYVNNGEKWVDFGDIQGPAGEAGEDALIAEVNPSPIVFQTNDKGAITEQSAWFYVRVYSGSANITAQCKLSLLTDENSYSNLSAAPGPSMVASFGGYNSTTDSYPFLMTSSIVKTDPVSVNNNGTTETYKVARTAGYFTIKCAYGNRVCYAKVQFSVSVSAFFRSYIETDYGMKRQFKELKDNTVTISTFEQTANGISGRLDAVEGDYVKNAEISMFVSHDENGVIDTNITMNADNININASHRLDIASNGCMTINTSNFKLDEYGNVTCTNGNFSGTVNATAGTIGGFDISAGRIGTRIDDKEDNGISYSSSNEMTLLSDCIIFNGDKRQAVLGQTSLLGIPYLLSLKDEVIDYTSKTGISVAIRGSMSDNVAIDMGGGYISGAAFKTDVFAFKYYTQTNAPTRQDVYVDRSVNAIFVSTRCYWRAKSSDNYKTINVDVYIHLPDMNDYDDGHILFIKRGPDDAGNVYVIPGRGNEYTGTDGGQKSSANWINCYNNRAYTLLDLLNISYEGNAMMFMYFKGLTIQTGGMTYKGCWVQWNNPR